MSSKEEKIRRSFFLLFLSTLSLLSACSSPTTPKPHAYARIDFPIPAYQKLENNNYPYTFFYSKYAQIKMIAGVNEINIVYPKYNGTIYLTYKTIQNDFQDLSKDGYNFVYSHSDKADAIGEQVFSNPDAHVWSILYNLEGNVASPLQFIATDSTKHWLRGAIYINAEMNRDSLDPVIKYMGNNLLQLIQTLKWK